VTFAQKIDLSPSCIKQFREAAYQAMNRYRDNDRFCLTSLKRAKSLEDYAQQHADKLTNVTGTLIPSERASFDLPTEDEESLYTRGAYLYTREENSKSRLGENLYTREDTDTVFKDLKTCACNKSYFYKKKFPL
jgi:hypothetical protein